MRRLVGLARRVGRRLQALARPPRPVWTLPLTPGPPDRELADVWCAPVQGLMLNDYGQVFANPDRGAVGEAVLARLPGAYVCGEEVRFAPAQAPRLGPATVFMDEHAAHNYAHFLLEALPALLAAQESGALQDRPPIAPPLTPWQVDLLTLAGAPTPMILDAPLVRIAAGGFAPSAGAAGLDRVRARVLSALDGAPAGGRRLYFSRRDSGRAVMADELELEALLIARGFTVIRPETACARDLAILFRDAERVVASGTILANLLFSSSDAQIIELQPPGPPSAWTRDLARHVGAAWRVYAGPAPARICEIPLDPTLRPDSAFVWRLDVSAFAAFLDQAEGDA